MLVFGGLVCLACAKMCPPPIMLESREPAALEEFVRAPDQPKPKPTKQPDAQKQFGDNVRDLKEAVDEFRILLEQQRDREMKVGGVHSGADRDH